MTRLLLTDLSARVAHPEAIPELEDLHRLWKVDGYRLNGGNRFASAWGIVRVEVNDDRESLPGLTDYFETVPFTIVSERFVSLLRSYECDCEFLPVNVKYRGGWKRGEYFVLNVLTVIEDAVDRERSRFASYDEGPLEEITQLELKEAALGSAPIAFLKELVHYAVSDTLAEALSASGLLGFTLCSPESFRK